jgi:hypothetical protein
MKKSVFILIPILFLSLILQGCCCIVANKCGTECPSYTEKANNLEKLASWMSGIFSSESQAASDPEYRPIILVMKRVWQERTDGIWLLVEQAMKDQPPYRQRVYHLTEINPVFFLSSVNELPEPEKYVGEWKKEAPLKNLSPEKLIPREGCEIILKMKSEELFIGSTLSRECLSSHMGAAYATSEVSITSNQLKSWDRGFNDQGEQVWGAVKGGYIFEKLETFPL